MLLDRMESWMAFLYNGSSRRVLSVEVEGRMLWGVLYGGNFVKRRRCVDRRFALDTHACDGLEASQALVSERGTHPGGYILYFSMKRPLTPAGALCSRCCREADVELYYTFQVSQVSFLIFSTADHRSRACGIKTLNI
jgi:hypothetical protein